MSNVAKGGFPGCPRRKVGKRKRKNFCHRVQGHRWKNDLAIMEQLKKNLKRFYEIFGDSEEDEEFYGFSSEECGLRAYKRVSSGNQSTRQIPDILCSPIDLSKKKVTTRLAHARNSLDALPSSERTRRRKRTIIRRKYSKSEVPIIEGHNVPSEPLVMLHSIGSTNGNSDIQGFIKYKNSNLDFHRLSETQGFRQQSTNTLRSPVSRPSKTSPIKPATFIAPSSDRPVHHVTNVTPTCLKIKINPDEATGPGHPKVLAKALLARANKRAKRPTQKTLQMAQPIHTSTPISAPVTKSKARSFILPMKSSRSSRIIKANPKYLDSDSADAAKGDEASNHILSLSKAAYPSQMLPTKSESSTDSSSKGRPLLKEATFRVAALANINNKPLPTRTINRDRGTRMRARKLIKRARFKHPTSSSTLVIGNDFEEDTDKKRNLIKEATFKMPNQSNYQRTVATKHKEELSDLGLGKEVWKKIIKNDCKYDPVAPLWTRQEIHNILHGANTFNSSWTTVARHYEYHPLHRDWCSVRLKAKFLQSMGLLSTNMKVKSSILLQLKHQYSSNPKVTVFTQRELRQRGMECNVECDIGAAGRMIKDSEEMLKDDSLKNKSPSSRHKAHLARFNKWRNSVEKDPRPESIHLGLTKQCFSSMCMCRGNKPQWSAFELHNILHGIHIFGIGEWHSIRDMYLFQRGRNNLEIRTRHRAVVCKGLVTANKVKKDILPMLQPKFSSRGKKYFGVEDQDSRRSQPSKERIGRNATKVGSKKRDASSDSDLTSPARKQAYHLFGTAPVWDNTSSASGLQSLKSSSEVEEDQVCEQVLSTPSKSRDGVGRTTSESTAKKGKKTDKPSKDGKGVKSGGTTKSRGPRIKHVCRRASLVTGYKSAVYSDDGARLSALPKEEREKIAAEAEKLRGVASESTMSSDTDGETGTTPRHLAKQAIKRRDKLKTNFVKKKSERTNSGVSPRESSIARRYGDLQKRNASSSIFNTEPITRSKSPSPNLPKHSASAGIILSPDSRRQLQQELHERDQYLPSIVKIDDWKERYELDDLWKIGGVAIITSTTPSTQFVCFLCGSVGKTRPIRRISANSETSLDSNENYVHTPLFIFCCSCCEPFHPFCLDDHEQQSAITDAKKGIWICKRCRFCKVCGKPGDLLECKRCNKTYHSACLGSSYPTKPSRNRVWVCMRCVRCRSCGASRPGRRPGSKWTHDFQLCQRCGDLFDKGNFCPICRRCYRDEDYESRMVQCATCKRWVHSRCESLTIEMYTLLSHLPDDVQYVCPDCDGRRATVELELSHSDTALTDDSGNDSLEGDKMRGLLCKLPAPSWKKILENEVQTGIENVMMALFHNKEAACILKKSAVEEESGRPVDLFAVRFAVHNRRYESVAEFSSDVCCILDTVDESDSPDPTEGKRRRRTNVGARGAFCEEMQKVFPWFDVYTGRVRDSSDVPEDLLPHATLPPHSDHDYAQWQDRDIDMAFGGPDTPLKNYLDGSSSNNIGTVIWASTPRKELDDMRQCLFCGKYGDDQPTNAGRLVYCGQDEWVHVNCALWSAEVFERHDGSLQNVYSAVSRGRMMKCELCKLPGATVGCNTRDCPKNYHFVCAKHAQCSFQDDKKVFCSRHLKNIDSELVSEEGFEIARRVVVDNDEMRPNKRWQRGMNSQNVTILLGSATVHQLGQLSASSDGKDYLVPVNFRMTRMFWSTVQAGRRVRYTITVTEQKSTPENLTPFKDSTTCDEEKVDNHGNHTISHADDDKPLNSIMPVKTHIPGADACRSNLLDRIDLLGPMPRRKSLDKSVSAALRQRLPDSHYTVVGSCNRTLPQTITPLPSIKRSNISFQRLLPSCTESTSPSLTSNNQSKADREKTRIDESGSKGNQNWNKAVLVSPQNPFLNLSIEGPMRLQNSLPLKDKTVNLEFSSPPVASGRLQEACVKEVENGGNKGITRNPKQDSAFCGEGGTVPSGGVLHTSVKPTGSDEFPRRTMELVEIVNPPNQPSTLAEEPERASVHVQDSSQRTDATKQQNETALKCKASHGADPGIAQSPSSKLPVAFSAPNEKCNVESSIETLNEKEKALSEPSEMKDGSSMSSKMDLRVKIQRLETLASEGLPLEDQTLKRAASNPASILQHVGVGFDEGSTTGSEKLSEAIKSRNLWSRKKLVEKEPIGKSKTILKSSLMNNEVGSVFQNRTTKEAVPTSISLLQHARDALDKESATTSTPEELDEPVKSGNLWWQKKAVDKRSAGKSRVERKSTKNSYGSGRKKAKKNLRSVASDDDMDNCENAIARQTRSRTRRASVSSVTNPASSVKGTSLENVDQLPKDDPTNSELESPPSVETRLKKASANNTFKMASNETTTKALHAKEVFKEVKQRTGNEHLTKVQRSQGENDRIQEEKHQLGSKEDDVLTEDNGNHAQGFTEKSDLDSSEESEQDDVLMQKDVNRTTFEHKEEMVSGIVTRKDGLGISSKEKNNSKVSQESEGEHSRSLSDFDSHELSSDDLTSPQHHAVLNLKSREEEKFTSVTCSDAGISVNDPSKSRLMETLVDESFHNEDRSTSSESGSGMWKSPVRLRNLRKFARRLDSSKKGPDSSKLQHETRKSSSSRRGNRRFSHDPFSQASAIKVSNVVCNGVHSVNPKCDDENPPFENCRMRSRSADLSAKKRKSVEKLQDQHFNGERRYPRRNPFTCLRSFSGLSPNYAIQSYSSKSRERDDRATLRLLKKETKATKKKYSSQKKKSTASRSRNSSEASVSTDSSLICSHDLSDSSKKSNPCEASPNFFGEKCLSRSDKDEICDVKTDMCSQSEGEILTNSKSDGIVSPRLSNKSVQEANSVQDPDPRVDPTESGSHQAAPKMINGENSCDIALNKDGAKSTFNEEHCDIISNVPTVTGDEGNDNIISGVPETVEDNKGCDIVTNNSAPKTIDEKESCDVGLNDHTNKESCTPDQTLTDATEPPARVSEVMNQHISQLPEVVAPVNMKQSDIPEDDILCSEPSENAALLLNIADIKEAFLNAQPTESVERQLKNEGTNLGIPSGERTEKVTKESNSEEDQIVSVLPDESCSNNSLPPIEITRGLTEQNSKTAETSPVVIEPDIITENKKPQQLPLDQLTTSPISIRNPLPSPNEKVTTANPGTFNPASDDIESPLSPRDEPRLPLPMQTESFLVTSECPVLNADEVQSLLEMPPTTTTSSTPVFTHATPSPSAQYQYYQTPVQQQYAFVTIPQQAIVSYRSPQNIPVIPMDCGNSGTIIMYGQNPTHSSNVLTVNSRNTCPVRVDGRFAQPVLVSPNQKNAVVNYQYVQPQFQMMYQTPIGTVLSPSQTYIGTPLKQSRRQNLVYNTLPPDIPVTTRNSTPVSHVPTMQVAHTRVANPKSNISKFNQKPKKIQHHPPTTTQQALVKSVAQKAKVTDTLVKEDDVQLTPDQAQTLEKMIEFFSNKNNLSNEEKQIVRAIIAQQIKNKSLPLPSQESMQQNTSNVVSDHGTSQERTSIGQKRKQNQENIPTPTKKKPRNWKSQNKGFTSPEKPCHEEIGQSPLLDVYMNAVRAESTTDDALVKKWRDVVRNLSKNNIYLDVPWHLRQGHRGKENRLPPPPQSAKSSYLMYEIRSDDGYYAKGSDLQELVVNLLDAVQDCRANACIPPTSLCLSSILSPHAFLGVSHDAIRFFAEQLPGARHCLRYRAKYYKHREPPAEVVTHINPHGCARAEKYQGRSKPDMFSFLASKHRVPPLYNPSQTQNVDMQQNSTRRPTSMDLPMAMRFRHLKTSAREAVGVYRSAIHGRGLYCKRDIEAGEMVMEYTGEVIRCFFTDRREKMYEQKGIGCYMFRMDDMYVVDATVMGSGARFINHSCEPSCYSRIVTIDGKKHIIIFALRKILRGEELTYDYKFPIEAEDQKIMCNCGAKTCRKYMN